MSEFTLQERIAHKFCEFSRPFLASMRRKRLNNTNFTIIANNCWAGVCYEYFGLQKTSPTIGMYFFPDEYLRFLNDIHRYLDEELTVVNSKESRYRDELYRRGQEEVLIGILGDVEMVLLHYKSSQLAKEKWDRRVKRINWDNIIYKFSYMNGCTDSHIHLFEEICTRKRIKHFEFVPKDFVEYDNAYVIPVKKGEQISNDTFYWNKYFDVVEFLNGSKIENQK